MSAAGRGAGAGTILGIVALLLLQQLGEFDLSAFLPGLIDLIGAALVGALFGAVIGWSLGRRRSPRRPPPEEYSATAPAS